jgi:membrane-associated phospholipid phosphatase
VKPLMILAVDRAVARRVAGTDSRVLDRVMAGLSRLADHGVLWIVVSAGLRATGDRWARRAAWRGLGAMAAASAAVNVLGKSLPARDRPQVPVPAGRRPARPPRRASFPSGHAASAAAFATGVAL